MTVATPVLTSAANPYPMGAATRGRTTISARALNRLVSAVAADALGVNVSAVGAEIIDDQGDLALTISAPIRIVSLNRVNREPSVIARTGGTILERSEQARQYVHRRLGELTGSTISQVTVRINAADIRPEDRVK